MIIRQSRRARGAKRTVGFGLNSKFLRRTPAQTFYIIDLGLFVLCLECSAKHFKAERPRDGQFEKCCKKGRVRFNTPQPPPALLARLYRGNDIQSQNFLDHPRDFNSAMSFTSCAWGRDARPPGQLVQNPGPAAVQHQAANRAQTSTPGFNVVTVHGALYHYQGPLEVGEHDTPAFAQLLFLDKDIAAGHRQEAVAHRYGGTSPLRLEILEDLHEMLEQFNPFIGIYKTARERLRQARQQDGDFRLVLNPRLSLVMRPGADRRRENLPTVDEVAGLIPDELDTPGRRDVVLAVRGVQAATVGYIVYRPRMARTWR